MVSFYPGPSRTYDEIPNYVRDAHRKGVLSMNHRSEEFVRLSRKTISLLKKRLDIPQEYTLFFASSATECWEIISQSLIPSKSIHLFNGAFGEKWYDYTHRLHPASEAVSFSLEALPDASKMVFADGEVICITQNETSNGTQVSNTLIDAVRMNNPRHLVAVDVTSSMAGIRLSYGAADIWFASVQKCFGLPAGLAILVVSPKAMQAATQMHEKRHYNSLLLMAEMMERWQTPCTPNVLSIYLLMRTLHDRPSIRKVHETLTRRANAWYSFFSKSKKLKPLVSQPEVQSTTVLTIQAKPGLIQKLKRKGLKKGILLGSGYGQLKSDTFRIANFPALKEKEIEKLKRFLTPYL